MQADNKENNKASIYWPFMRGIHRSPVPLKKASDGEGICTL